MKSLSIRLLLAANMILLGVSLALSIQGYSRLPENVASWLSLWKGGLPQVERSWTFFVYPTGQFIFFAVFLALARRLRDLKKEVVYLALIFFNLIFIHLQTSLILLSHGIGNGIKPFYFIMLIVMILFVLGPYYRLRRRLLGV